MTETNERPARALERAAAECVARSAGLTLYSMCEAPDADLLDERGFHVGLEVVQTVDQSYLEAKVRLADLRDAVQIELESREIRGCFSVYFAIDEVLTTNRTQRAAVPAQLAEFLQQYAEQQVEAAALRAHGVSCVARIERSEAQATIVGLGWRSRSLNGSLAEICLQKKDEKLLHYRQKNGDYYREYWLAIASLGPGTVEDGGFSMLLERDFTTNYDRVFLIIHGSNGSFVDARDVTPSGPRATLK